MAAPIARGIVPVIRRVGPSVARELAREGRLEAYRIKHLYPEKEIKAGINALATLAGMVIGADIARVTK